MQALENFIKTYSEHRYKYTTLVRHKGTVIGLAMDDRQRIWYTVLDLNDQSVSSPLDVHYWNRQPELLMFPLELGRVGFRAAGLRRIPEENAELDWDEKSQDERWSSTTGRLTDDAPFQALSDGHHVFVFRQSIAANHERQLEFDNQPVVDRTLLVDRFVFTGAKLKPALEVRFQRSRKSTPAGAKDTLGNRDLEGKPFYEPTLELSLVRNLERGRFSVLLLPTATPESKRWQIFAWNRSNNEQIDSYNIERSRDGLFNLQGTLHYTCPKGEHRTSVYADEPGECPICPATDKKTLVPIVEKKGYAESALEFDGADDYIELPGTEGLLEDTDFTVEAWVKCDDASHHGGVLGTPYSLLANVPLLQPYFYFGDQSLGYSKLKADAWYHLCFRYTQMTKEGAILVNGALASKSATAQRPNWYGAAYNIGKAGAHFFKGCIDEVRIWNRPRSEEEIRADMNFRLVGDEPGLVGYWRFDEGQGNRVKDATGAGRHGTIRGDPKWVSSDAPLGEHPGVRRSSFGFAGHSVASGMDAVLYHQQETGGAGYEGGEKKPMKTNARVMLAMTAWAHDSPRARFTTPIAVLDFAVSRHGKLALVPDSVELQKLTAPASAANRGPGDAVEVAMPLVSIDVFGHTLSGGLLDFARAKYTPRLFDTANGNINLYYRGSGDQFFAAYFDVTTARAVWTLDCGSGAKVLLAARNAEFEMAETVVRVSNGRTNQTCTLKLENRNPRVQATETWAELPRDSVRLVETLNGRSSDYDYENNRTVELREQPAFSSNRGSLLCLASAQGKSGELQNGTFRVATPTDRCTWIDHSHGTALSLDGGTKCARSTYPETAAQFAVRGDVTLEAWIRPEAIDGHATIIRQRSTNPESGYCLGIDPTSQTTPLVFEGQTAYVELPPRSDDFSRGVTLEAWVYYDIGPEESFPTWSRIIDLGNGEYEQLLALGSLDDTGKPCVFVDHDYRATDSAIFARRTWQHLAVTIGPTRPDNVVLYLDGTPVHGATLPLPVSAKRTSNYLGKSNFAADHLFKGRLDEVRIWNYPRAGTQIRQEMRRRASGYEEGLLGCWRDGGSRLAHDCSRHRRHGQLRGVHRPFVLEGGYLQLPSRPRDDFSKGVTLEAWVRCEEVPDRQRWSRILSFGNTGGEDVLELLLHENSGKVSFQINDQKFHAEQEVLERNQFYHVAAVYDPELPDHNARIFIDGQLRAHHRFESGPTLDRKREKNYIGQSQKTAEYQPFRGKLDELRLWNCPRTPEQIMDAMDRRLSASEPNLLAYWRTGDDSEKPLYETRGGTVHCPVPVSGPEFDNEYRVCFGSLIRRGWAHKAKTTSPIGCNRWTHLAGVFEQSYALDFDGERDRVECANQTGIDLRSDLSIVAAIQVDELERGHQGIIGKGASGESSAGQMSYALYLNREGRLIFRYEDTDGKSREFRSDRGKIQQGKFHWVAVTKERKAVEDREPGNGAQGQAGDGDILEMTPGGQEAWNEIKLFVDGTEPVKTFRCPAVDAGGSEEPAEIGVARLEQGASYFDGAIAEVRLWSEALPGDSVFSRIEGHELGLSAWWRMEENQGAVVYDSKGSAHGIGRRPEWIKSPDPRGSKLSILVNGVYQETEEHEEAHGTTQISIGVGEQGSDWRGWFKGQLDEIRIWKRPRTQEQIQDNMFRPLLGEKQDLVAYYSCDPDTANLKDGSGRDRHLQLIEVNNSDWRISEAPVGDDIPQARGALAGIPTPFNRTIHGAPAAQEYGDLQYDAEHNRIGVLKRCYAFIRDNQWHLVTGFKVGELISEWVTQVQYKPQIKGYIEGTPPVPGENLTAGPVPPDIADYMDHAAVKLTQADQVIYNYSTSTEGGMDTAFEYSGGATVDAGDMIVSAPLGVGVAMQPISVKLHAGVQVQFESSNSVSEDQSASIGTVKTREVIQSLSGNWEAPAAQLPDCKLSRRFGLANVGMALVESATADVFALRMRHNKALVAYRIVPNPDIPRDVNVLTFPINPAYTKQGTLDGKVGFKTDGSVITDPDYPNAASYGEWSYFKPREAYQLKKRIERQEEMLRAHYENLEVSSLTGGLLAGSAGAGAAGGALAAGMGAFAPLLLAAGPLAATVGGAIDAADKQGKLPKGFAKRSLVNTYVWTADGGLYSESQESSMTRQETLGGEFSLSGGAGLSFGGEIAFASIGFEAEMTAMLGGHLTITTTKSREAEESFGLEIDLDVPGDLQEYDAALKRVYDKDNNVVNVPGKVDAYRFITFFLAPDVNNFDHLANKVVDPQWLDSDSPNAIALRQAIGSQQGGGSSKSLPWRIMHRVTFVSRLLPPVTDPTATALPATHKALQEAEISSNYALIRMIEPYVRPKIDAGYEEFKAAVRQAVERHLPGLADEAAKTEIVKFMCDYFQVYDD